MSPKLLFLVSAVAAVTLVSGVSRASAGDGIVLAPVTFALPDLVISSVTPTTVTVKNEPVALLYPPTSAAGGFRVTLSRYHLECWYAVCHVVTDRVRSFDVSSLVAGASVSIMHTSFYDPYVGSRIAVWVDSLAQVAERDETNNMLAPTPLP